ncbi:E3 ubiquitin-protein ligase HERC2 [Cyclospora cayetanensis]|uniref:E3 ubiquitin-protein ligase HERC2 n=1 Tax=Cyclospora cayetanensis TaxID=88456 RepID=A0A6P6RXC7_9EIME|nr:E3 ubiquitin-protein ligase HERC2 [Cyclospora cayetanensis]
MGQSATKSGVVVWGPMESEDTGWDGSSPDAFENPSVGLSPTALPNQGVGSAISNLQLRLVDGLKATGVRAVAAGGKHFACLVQTGDIFVWGAGAQGQLGLGDCADVVCPKILRPVQGKLVQAVSCGFQHTACVLHDGSAFTWGCALHGRLGLGGLNLPQGGTFLGEEDLAYTRQVVSVPQHVKALARKSVTDVSCGGFHTAFLVVSGDGTALYTCGLGLSGRLGVGDEDDRHTPEKVQGLEGLVLTAVACGGHHTACIASPGCLYTWGGAAFGKLGLVSHSSVLKPSKVGGPLVGKMVSSVALGTHHSACTTTDGELYTWGQGRRLGHEQSGEADQPLPRRVEALVGFFVHRVACGERHTVCVLNSGDIWAWGTSRAVGHGDPSVPPNAPTPLRLLRGKGVSSVACGGPRSIALCNASHAPSRATNEGLYKNPSSKAVDPAILNSRKTGSHQSQHSTEPHVMEDSGGPTPVVAFAETSGNNTASCGSESLHVLGFAPGDDQPIGCSGEGCGSDATRSTLLEMERGANKGDTSPEALIAHLDRELQAARMDSLLLAALLKGAATELDAALQRIRQLEAEVKVLEKSSADAGERLATLRGHYEQHIKELGQQLAQQDVQFHAALAARSGAAVGSGSHAQVGVGSQAALLQHLSLEEALADPLGSQGPSFFLRPRGPGNNAPAETAGGSNTPLGVPAPSSPSRFEKNEGMCTQGMVPKPRGAETFMLPLSTAYGSSGAARPHQQRHPKQPPESKEACTMNKAFVAQDPSGGGSSPAIPIFVLDDSENPWL